MRTKSHNRGPLGKVAHYRTLRPGAARELPAGGYVLCRPPSSPVRISADTFRMAGCWPWKTAGGILNAGPFVLFETVGGGGGGGILIGLAVVVAHANSRS